MQEECEKSNKKGGVCVKEKREREKDITLVSEQHTTLASK